MSRIGLVDVDNTGFPNIALDKIATYHKSIGDEVVWVDPLFGGGYDKVYMSKIFTFSPDYDYPIVADEIDRGGTGYDLTKKLPTEIDRLQPDYDMLGVQSDTALSIIRTISQHNDYIFNVLNEGVTEEVKVSETYSSAARATLLSILPDQFTSKDMKAAAVKISKSLRTVERQIRRAIQKGQVKELGKGSYQKIS